MKKNNNKLIAAVILVVAAIAVLVGVYFAFGPKTASGSKSVSIEVVDNNGGSKVYKTKTDAEYLSQVMEELAKQGDFSYQGDQSDYGIYINTINGVTADSNADGAYWAIYVNGEYGMYGADSQPVADQDAFKLAYEVFSYGE